MSHETAELRAIRQQDREVIQSDIASARHSAHAGTFVELDEHRVIAVRGERCDCPGPSDHTKSNDGFVIRDRSAKIRDWRRTRPMCVAFGNR